MTLIAIMAKLSIINICYDWKLSIAISSGSNNNSTPSFTDCEIPNVIYKMLQKIELKNALFRPDFRSFFGLKPQHIVVESYFLPSETHSVIRTTASTCHVHGNISTIISSKKVNIKGNTPLSIPWKYKKPTCILLLETAKVTEISDLALY
jgi:hypothetical protein